MFRAITRLLFGAEEQTPDDFKSGDTAEEEWQVVSHQEAGSAEAQGPEQPTPEQASSAPYRDVPANMEASDVISVVDAEAAGRAVAGAAAHLKPLTLAEHLTLVQKARNWSDRHRAARSATQRHNRVRQGFQHSLFHLQQPGRRSLAH